MRLERIERSLEAAIKMRSFPAPSDDFIWLASELKEAWKELEEWKNKFKQANELSIEELQKREAFEGGCG